MDLKYRFNNRTLLYLTL